MNISTKHIHAPKAVIIAAYMPPHNTNNQESGRIF